MTEKIIIDGSFLEGGGQIIRTSLALSALLKKPFIVNNIRKGRKVPGLKAQHKTAILALKKLCKAKTNEFNIGSEILEFNPNKLKPQTLSLDIGTAGSITLMLQSLWMPLILSNGNSRLKIKGGTDVKWSMPIDYLKEIFIPQLSRYTNIDLKVIRRGFFPKGGGEIDLKIKSKYSLNDLNELGNINSLANFDNNQFIGLDNNLVNSRNNQLNDSNIKHINLLEQGRLVQIKGVSYASSELQKSDVAERQAKAAKITLSKYNVPIDITVEYSKTDCMGTGIVLWAIFSLRSDEIDVENPIRLGSDALGEKGVRAEKVGEIAAKKLITEIESGAVVDSHMADNLVPFIALFGGAFKTSKITDHTRTNIYIINKFMGDILEINEEEKIIKKISH